MNLYSLGALGYFLLTGRAVFEGDSIAELRRRHSSEIPVPPGARIGKTFDPQLETLLISCLEKEPAAREFAQVLSVNPLAERWTPERRAA